VNADISFFGIAVCLGVLLIGGERLVVFGIRLLLEVFESERELDVGDWRDCMEKKFVIGLSHQKLTDQNKRGM